MDNTSFRAIYALTQDWAKRTDKAEKQEFKRLKIGLTGALYPTIKTTVRQSGAKIIAEHSFLTYGRFVDMGAGPGSPGYGGKATISSAVSKLENKDRNRELALTNRAALARQRKPKKFYGPIFYGRLAALMGITSAKMQETAISLVKQQLQDAPESANPYDDISMYQ